MLYNEEDVDFDYLSSYSGDKIQFRVCIDKDGNLNSESAKNKYEISNHEAFVKCYEKHLGYKSRYRIEYNIKDREDDFEYYLIDTYNISKVLEKIKLPDVYKTKSRINLIKTWIKYLLFLRGYVSKIWLEEIGMLSSFILHLKEDCNSEFEKLGLSFIDECQEYLKYKVHNMPGGISYDKDLTLYFLSKDIFTVKELNKYGGIDGIIKEYKMLQEMRR